MATDIKVVLLTLSSVIKREGISGEGCATAKDFDGKN